MTFLLDTNVVSELRRARPDRRVVEWVGSTAQQSRYISALTIGEIRKGVESLRVREPLSAALLDDWLGSVVREFSGHVLAVDATVGDRWGRLAVSLASTQVGPIDGLIAATALVHGLTVVTRNVRHFEPTGVPTLDPFATG